MYLLTNQLSRNMVPRPVLIVYNARTILGKALAAKLHLWRSIDMPKEDLKMQDPSVNYNFRVRGLISP